MPLSAGNVRRQRNSTRHRDAECSSMASESRISYENEEAAMARRGRYGLLNFGFDVLMTVFTAGFWLIWIFVREMRN